MHTNAMYSWYKEKIRSPPRHASVCVHLMALSTIYTHLNVLLPRLLVFGIWLDGSYQLPARRSLRILVLPVRCVCTSNRGQLRLPLVTVREQLLLVVKQLFPCLGGVLGVGALDNGVHGARLLAEAAVDALGHVDVVAGCAAGAVGALLGLDGDGLGWADGLAQLAGNASLLTGRVAAQGVLATEAGRDGALLEGVEDCVTDYCVSGCPNDWPLTPEGSRTYGGLKNCSSTTYMPRNISVKRK